MAGSFGFEKEHYELSMSLGKMNLFDKINQHKQDVEIVSMLSLIHISEPTRPY